MGHCLCLLFPPACSNKFKYLECFTVMMLTGKSSGSPKHGCPFCSASSPYVKDGVLYTMGDLLGLHQVKHIFINIKNVFSTHRDTLMEDLTPKTIRILKM